MKVSKLSYIVAIVLALLAGVAVYVYQSTADSRALQGKAAVSVIVAKADLAVGTKLGDAVAAGSVGYATYPEGTLPADALRTVDNTNTGLVLNHAVSAGQLILNSELTTFVNPNQLIQIPAGRIAVSVNIDDAARVASFVQPGSRVVIYWTPADNQVSQVLLPDADVIAVGAVSTASTNPANTGNGSLVTLSLTPADAPRVVLASKTGSLYFGLLSDGTAVSTSSRATAAALRGN